MPRGRPTKSQAKDLPAAIREAALRRFARQGFHGTTLPEIAQGAGVAIGTIYNHFPSKEALANTLFQELGRTAHAQLWENFPWEEGLPEQFGCFWRRLLALGTEHHERWLFLDATRHGDLLDEASRAVAEAFRAPALRILALGQATGRFKPLAPSLAAALVFGMAHHLFLALDAGRLLPCEDLVKASGQCCWDALAQHGA